MHNEYLEILHLQPGASAQDIKNAYRALAKKYHPDISKDEKAREQFIKITEAYKFLTDVGPRPNHEKINYNYDPQNQEFEQRRENAHAYAWQKAREKSLTQQETLFRIYDIFNYLNIVVIAFNLLLIMDYLLPPNAHQERVQAVSEVYYRSGNRSTHLHDQVLFENYKLKVKKRMAEGIADNKALIYTTPVLGFVQHAEVQLEDEVRRLEPSFGIYNILRILVPLALLFSILYYFLNYKHINKITLVVVLTIALFFEVLLIFSFS